MVNIQEQIAVGNFSFQRLASLRNYLLMDVIVRVQGTNPPTTIHPALSPLHKNLLTLPNGWQCACKCVCVCVCVCVWEWAVDQGGEARKLVKATCFLPPRILQSRVERDKHNCDNTNNNCVKLLQSCLTLYDSTDCGLPGSSVHGIFQALLWKVMEFESCLHLQRP